jgi:hypothetical protein
MNPDICRSGLLLCILGISIFMYGQGNKLIVDDFENYREDSIATAWKGRSDEAFIEYKVKTEHAENSYLEVISEESNMFILKKIKVDLVKFPYLNWQWRVNEWR